MKPTLLALLTAALLASCAPKEETTTTTDNSTVSTETNEPGVDNPIAEGEGAMDNAADPGVDSTMTNDDDANTSEEVDMAVGDGLEGTVTDFDGTAKTFTLNENDANYAVTIDDATVFEGGATTADEFFGADRADASVAVEGEIDEAASTLKANKITLN
ncbi:hypothetical protein GCM10008959_07810 [Deinococcus seoulensis]|uniref:DUF5666 domain-containing protein n=1 Tax=Deinococcus seoulensis TaxID=1837379 RepID=A0ABQ2RN59_9DEIO|nr:hypothetical protein [Deinococcus seoulensis]GGR49052.1 hypothetical protein GCM10008959_07810 [Deinococcus seoulensis]